MAKQMTEKKMEKEVEQMWYKIASGVQVNIMDIGKIFKRGVTALKEGRDLETELKACVVDFRQN